MSGQNVLTKWALKPVVFVLGLLPLALLVLAVAQNRYANPVEAILQGSGEWALRFLLLTLSVTPLQFVFKWLWVARLRRMLGLFAFFYASLHLLIWLGLDLEFSLAAALSALMEKPFITAGMLAFAGLIPLALTSNKFSVRKLGTRWKSWHSAVYLLTVLAIVHQVWQVKGSDLLEPAIYLLILIALYSWRFSRSIK